ncbi:MYND-type domain-containing protein [Mycena kentingensis (nom. inval.)]|nr:MYND-type domain-containing protein [Mycena kentingensis (nom. inval.)]
MTTLHPALRPADLQNLPLRIRPDAQAACRIDGHSPQAIKVLRILGAGQIPEEKQQAVLPLVFHLLNPAGIPPIAALSEEVDEPTRRTLLAAALAIGAAYSVQIPSETASALWPRIWAWAHVFFSHWAHLKPLLPEMPDLFRPLIHCTTAFNEPSGAPSDVVLRAPGFRGVLASLWRRQLSAETQPRILRTLILDVSNLIMALEPSERTNFQELVDGVGGMRELAGLVVETLKMVLEKIELELDDNAYVSTIHSLVSLILHGDFSTLRGVGRLSDRKWEDLPLGAFVDALLDTPEFLAMLVRIVVSLCANPVPGTGYTVADIYLILGRVIALRQGTQHPSSLMSLGLILAIVRSAMDEYPGKKEVLPHLRRLLDESLDSTCVYRASALMLDGALKINANPGEPAQSETFQRCEMYPHWVALTRRSSARYPVLERLHASAWGLTGRHKICDNWKCNAMVERKKLFKCSACHALSYCSSDCQKLDWKSAGHREACDSYRYLIPTDRSNPTFDYKDRKYLALLLDEEYSNNFGTISAKQVAFLANAADADALPVTLFDYAAGPIRTEVSSVAHIADLLTKPTPSNTKIPKVASTEWADIVARARRSQGRLALHVVVSRARVFVLPLSTASNLIDAEVRVLASALRVGSKPGVRIQWEDVLQDPRFPAVKTALTRSQCEDTQSFGWSDAAADDYDYDETTDCPPSCLSISFLHKPHRADSLDPRTISDIHISSPVEFVVSITDIEFNTCSGFPSEAPSPPPISTPATHSSLSNSTKLLLSTIIPGILVAGFIAALVLYTRDRWARGTPKLEPFLLRAPTSSSDLETGTPRAESEDCREPASLPSGLSHTQSGTCTLDAYGNEPQRIADGGNIAIAPPSYHAPSIVDV